jgi:hypothetical protein
MKLPFSKLMLALLVIPPATLSADEQEDGAVRLVKELGGGVDRDEQARHRPVIVVYLAYTNVTPTDLKRLANELARVKTLRRLDLSNTGNTGTTDAGLKEISVLKQLHWLDLSGTRVTDAGLKHLAGLSELRELELEDTVVTDVGLKELATLRKLEHLNLCFTKVTDKGLGHLAMLKELRSLRLRETQVSEAGINELRKALPKCRIVR